MVAALARPAGRGAGARRAAAIGSDAGLRPADVVKRLHSGPSCGSATAAGRHAGRRHRGDHRPRGGRISVGGEIWTARALRRAPRIEAGETVGDLPDQGRHRLRPPGAALEPRRRPRNRPSGRQRQQSGGNASPGAVPAGPVRGRHCWPRRSASCRRHGRDRRAVRQVQGDPARRAQHRRAVRRQGPLHHRPARAGRLVPAAAGHHRGQPGGVDRHRHLLPGHRPGRGDVRDRQLHPGRSSSSP